MEGTRFRGVLEHGSATGLSGFVATTVRMERGVMASTRCRSIMVHRSTVRRDYGAPGLRCMGSPVHWYLRLLWRLRCAGTTVRRDYGAPGLRCTEADKFSGEHPRAPRFPAQVGTTCGARRPGSSDRASRSCRVSRQTPPESSIFGGSWIRREPPLPPSPAGLRDHLRGCQRRAQRHVLSGPEYFC